MQSIDSARVAGYVCLGLSLCILVGRLILCRWHRKPLDASSYFVFFSIFTLIARTIATEIPLRTGTANDVLIDVAVPYYFDAEDARSIKIGSILTLLARVLFTATLWSQVSILLLFYSNITSGIRLVSNTITIAWLTWAVSFTAIVFATFLECQPFSLYWQVRPNPGNCTKAYVQLVLQGVSNVVLDLLLLFIAYPLVTLRQRSWGQQCSLYTLFTLGTFCIIITNVRLALVFKNESSQTSRSLWASVQITVSIFVANAPTIYGTIRTVCRQGSQPPTTPSQLNAERATRPSRPIENSWLKMADEDVSLHGLPQTPPPVLIYDEEYGMVAHNPTPPLAFKNDHYTHAMPGNLPTDVH